MRRLRGPSSSSGDAVAAPVVCEWIADDDALAAAVEWLVGEPEYAIDTEFLRERTYYPKLALVQVAAAGRILLIDPLAVDLSPFARVLESDAVAVLHAADQDLEVLGLTCGTVPRRIFDTQLAASFLGFSTPSLVTLAERLLGLRLSKGDRLTDWTVRPLTEAQRAYAAADVAHLLELRRLLVDELTQVGRADWVDDECELLRTRTRESADPRRAWWRLKDGRVLRGDDRLVAQELAAWREERARADDRPVRFVLPDLAILAIAQGRPRTAEALAALRGVDGRFAKPRQAEPVLAILERARAMSASDLQLPESEEFDRRLRPAVALVSAWVSQLSRDARIDTSLLATRSDLVAFLRGDANARLASGWRADVVGRAVSRLLSGDAAIAFESSGTLTLEQRSRTPVTVELAVPTAAWTAEPAGDGADGLAL